MPNAVPDLLHAKEHNKGGIEQLKIHEMYKKQSKMADVKSVIPIITNMKCEWIK